MITWILDKHVDRVRNAPTPFFEGALKRNHIVHGLRDSLLPKPVDLTGIELSGPTIVRGSHGFVNYVQKELNPLPGGFTHPTNFQMTTYIPIMKEFCLNDDFGIIEYGTFNNHSVYYTHLGTQPVFVKPLEDLKKLHYVNSITYAIYTNQHFWKEKLLNDFPFITIKINKYPLIDLNQLYNYKKIINYLCK